MLHLTEGRLAALSSLSGRSRVLVGALAASGALVAAPAAMASAPTYTWTGAGTVTPGAFSDSGNWSGSAPSAPASGSFAFPGSACPGGCSVSVDQSGDTAQGLSVSGDAGYIFTGTGLNLAQPASGDALSAASDSSGNPSGPAAMDVPLTLTGTGAQTWSLDGGSDGAGVNLSGVSGSNDVNVSMSNDAWLGFAAGGVTQGPVSLGALTITGADPAKTGQGAPGNGEVDLEENVNDTSGAPVTFNDVSLEQDDPNTQVTTGPLNLNGTWASLAVGQTLTSTGAVTMDAANYVDMTVGGTSSTAAGLHANGNVALDGTLGLQVATTFDQASNTTICPTIGLGSTQTLIQSDGSLTGTFHSDSNLDAGTWCADAPGGSVSYHPFWFHISYTGSAVTATAIPSTSLTMAASAANAVAGDTVTYTAKATPILDAGVTDANTPGGTVQFYSDSFQVVCQNGNADAMPVGADGTAKCVTTLPSAGTYNVWASYTGDANFARSQTDGPSTVTVAAAPVKTPAAPAAPSAPVAPAAPAPPVTAPTKTPAAPAAGSGTATVAKPVSKPGSGKVTLPVACAAHGASCTVKVAVTTVVTVRKHGKKIHRVVVLGTRRTTVAAGHSGAVKVALTKAGRRLLATHKHLTTQVHITSHAGHGVTRTSVKKVTLSAVAHRHGSKSKKKK